MDVVHCTWLWYTIQSDSCYKRYYTKRYWKEAAPCRSHQLRAAAHSSGNVYERWYTNRYYREGAPVARYSSMVYERYHIKALQGERYRVQDTNTEAVEVLWLTRKAGGCPLSLSPSTIPNPLLPYSCPPSLCPGDQPTAPREWTSTPHTPTTYSVLTVLLQAVLQEMGTGFYTAELQGQMRTLKTIKSNERTLTCSSQHFYY